MADCHTCGFNIKGKCRVPGEEVLALYEINMEEECDEWCDRKSHDHTTALQEYEKQYPTPTESEVCHAVGSNSMDIVQYLLGPTAALLADSKDEDIRRVALNNTTTLLNAIKPQNELEGMLAAQMVCVHDLLMKQVHRCATEDRVDVVNLKINQIAKLSRTFIAQLDALNKHRGKGQQKITVEHVTVNEGGQAIVGNVAQGGQG